MWFSPGFTDLFMVPLRWFSQFKGSQLRCSDEGGSIPVPSELCVRSSGLNSALPLMSHMFLGK